MKTVKPVIGITVDCCHDPEDARTRGNMTLNWNYGEMVAKAGGVPLIVPPMADMEVVSKLIDGWLIPGGDDIDASHFGEENHPAAKLQDPERYAAESRLFRAIDRSMPVLGICYGCQFLNVVQGGTLHQHLPDVENASVHTGGPMQEYKVDSGTKLSAIVNGEAAGKSYHHQAVKDVAGNLTVTARSEDGTIEALESSDRPWMIGVQWHPERTPDATDSNAIFGRFIEAARAYAESKGA